MGGTAETLRQLCGGLHVNNEQSLLMADQVRARLYAQSRKAHSIQNLRADPGHQHPDDRNHTDYAAQPTERFRTRQQTTKRPRPASFIAQRFKSPVGPSAYDRFSSMARPMIHEGVAEPITQVDADHPGNAPDADGPADAASQCATSLEPGGMARRLEKLLCRDSQPSCSANEPTVLRVIDHYSQGRVQVLLCKSAEFGMVDLVISNQPGEAPTVDFSDAGSRAIRIWEPWFSPPTQSVRKMIICPAKIMAC